MSMLNPILNGTYAWWASEWQKYIATVRNWLDAQPKQEADNE